MSGEDDETVRIATWSGPRNISTAMMRSFENRPDTDVVDEPFYGAFLAASRINHPMREEILAGMETDPEAIGESLLSAQLPGRIHYQKHMTHHMLAGFPRDWISHVTNVFLIRDPCRVVASYAAKRETVTFDDLGFGQQLEIFDTVAEHLGAAPPIVDADDVLRNPQAVLTLFCEACSISFCDEMLKWPAGPRASDGVWAAHWYGAVERSTDFAPPVDSVPELDGELSRLADDARPAYEKLYALRMKI